MRRRIDRLVIAALAAAGLLVAAAGRGVAAENLFPITVGSSWTFSGSPGGRPLTMIATVKSASKANGKITAVILWTVNGAPAQEETYIVSASEVARSKSGQGGANTITPPVPVIKYPLTVGKAWSWQGHMQISQGGQSATLPGSASLKVAGRESVKTAAGTFNAYRVDMKVTVTANGQTQSVPNTYWFAPGVGMVQQSITFPGPGGKPFLLKMAISKYTIKK